MIKKIIDLEAARDLLGEPIESEKVDKKTANAEKKKLKDLREKYPIRVSIAFKYPWWDLSHREGNV